MKLGKSLIITGLLFSSILGSVNVGSITAMATTAPIVDGIGKDAETTVVDISYKLSNGPVNDSEFDKAVLKTVNVKKGEKTVALDKIKLPNNYKMINTEPLAITDVNGKDTVMVTVEKAIIPESISVAYLDKDGKPMTSDAIKDLKSSLAVNNREKQISKENLKGIPENFEVVKYDIDSKTVTLKEVAPQSPKPGDNGDKNKGKKKPSRHSGYVSQRVRISFIDQDGDEVGYQQLNGKVGFDKKISAPAGYSFVNANEANIKFDKSGNKELKLKVTKNRPVSTMEEGIVTTNSGDFKHLYTIEGKDITNRGLSGDSKWYTDQYATINGEKMFRVATNEWVKATDVYK